MLGTCLFTTGVSIPTTFILAEYLHSLLLGRGINGLYVVEYLSYVQGGVCSRLHSGILPVWCDVRVQIRLDFRFIT